MARRIRDEHRESALRRLARSEPASAEAGVVYAAYRRRHPRRLKVDTERPAQEAALRVAQVLLSGLLEELEAARRRGSAA
ncbi:hypothetical protein AB0M97_30555 [Streptomyces sp. NPDC051207]|uniref:hypothetical protein n=1 Tax=Streptomyces sp. NPDC051207 TaxID=3154641 RepID=UPI00341BA485